MLILFWLAAIPASDYAGAAACQKCHPAEFRVQSESAHAKALALSKAPQPGEWAFGAGSQAITFVRRLAPEHYLEESQSWYRAIDGYARTPGHTSSSGVRDRIFDPLAAVLRCFACHSTGPLQVSADRGILPHELGVRCEACHGPAAAHVREPARNRPLNPARLAADEINNLCGQCHRMPGKERDESSLRNPWNVRHQPFMLAASKCFQESGGRLNCFNCHSPHAPLETTLIKYDAACGQCHSAPRHKTPVTGRTCAGCHMPTVQPQPHLVFANHRIAIYAAGDPLTPVKVSC